MREPWLQVAGLHDADEAAAMVAAGFNALGFPLRLPVHAEDLSENQAREVVAGLPDTVTAVLVTYLDHGPEIARLADHLGVSAVQLHGALDADTAEWLKHRDPERMLIKSLVVGRDDLGRLERTIQELAPSVDAFITDTHDPETGADGATGQVHDWAVSRRLVRRSPRPVIVAGGLTPGNVAAAVAATGAAGVDVHTGIEDQDGRKRADAGRAFVAAAQAAFDALRR